MPKKRKRNKKKVDIATMLETIQIANGWTQYKLAEEMGFCIATISKWRREEGYPNPKNLSKLVNFYKAAKENAATWIVIKDLEF